MKTIFDSCEPRSEVLKGELREEIFAARLRDVIEGKAAPVYQDSPTFFDNTYPTEGLRLLLDEALGRLTSAKPANNAIIRLETAFGGGKTHNLIALYHAAKGYVPGPSFVDTPLIPVSGAVRVVGIVGSDLQPRDGLDHGDVTTYTLWGELAYQLGGAAGYAHTAGSDQDRSAPGTGLLALQGPKSRALLSELTDADLASLKYMWAIPAQVAGVRALISRTGYTGELGYEILIPAEHAHDFFETLAGAGEKYGLALVGMTAAFSLRMEKGYIMRFDFAGGRTPYEVGLGWTVKPDKGNFIGRDALMRLKKAGFKDKLMTLIIQDGYVPPSGDAIFKDEAQIGHTTSAAFGYTIGQAITLGYVPIPLAKAGTEVTIQDKEGNRHPATVGQRVLYNPDSSKLRA